MQLNEFFDKNWKKSNLGVFLEKQHIFMDYFKKSKFIKY